MALERSDIKQDHSPAQLDSRLRGNDETHYRAEPVPTKREAELMRGYLRQIAITNPDLLYLSDALKEPYLYRQR